MRKNLLKSFVALAALCLGTMNVAAQNETATAPVKMTYIDYNQADVALGQLDTIRAGYNKVPAVDGTIGFGNTGWGENKIGVLKVDVSAIPGTVQKATLKAKISGSSDSKRTTGWGVALTDNEWAADLTYATAGSWTVSALLNGGAQVWSTQKSAAVFEEGSWDITEALSAGQSSATLLVYETAAAGGYMTEAYADVEYEPYEATTTKYDFEDGNNIFTDDSRIGSAVADDEVLGSKAVVFTAAGNCQNGYGFAHYDFTDLLNQPALVGVEFDYYNQSGTRAILTLGDRLVRQNDGGCSKNTYGSKGAIFRIGSTRDNFIINDYNLRLTDGTKTETVVDEETGEEKEVTTSIYGYCDKWLHVSVLANNDTKTVAWTVTDVATDEVVHSGLEAFWQADANELSQIDVFAWINNAMSGKVDNLEITNYKSNAVFADYTIQYIDSEGNQLKESRTGNGQVGKFVKLLDSDKDPIRTDDMKYLYDSDDSETVAIAEGGSAVISVKFKKAEQYEVVFNCTREGLTGAANRLAQYTAVIFEGDTYTFYPPRGILSGDKYYFHAASSYNGFSRTAPLSSDTKSSSPNPNTGLYRYTINEGYYTLDPDTVAYYSDIERLALPVEDEGNGTGLGQLVGTVNSWYSFSGGYFDRFAGGRGIRLDKGSYVYTEPIAEAATYQVTIYGRNDRSAGDPNPYALGLIREGSDDLELYDELVIPEWGSATTGASVVSDVAVPANAKLVIMNNNDAEASLISLDDISLTKTGDYVEPVTVGIITIVENVQTVNNSIYNLQGQVVKAATKGLYIQNGKKFIVK